MLRSLLSVIVAVIIGLTAAKFIENAGSVVLFSEKTSMTGNAPVSGGYQFLLMGGWFVGAFTAALLALLLGRRWAPLGALAAATIFLAASITILTFSLSWLLAPGTAIACAAAAVAAIKLCNAQSAYPVVEKAQGLFE